jgi:hypothetical protein
MSRRLKFSIRLLIALLVVALASWCWYFATRPPRREVLVLEHNFVHPPTVQWRAATAKERAAVIRSIVAQLEAFKADRYELAARYQSRALKNKFQTVENFRHAIRETYPQFANYKTAKFGEARASKDGKLLEIPIHLTGQDGVQVRALYRMALEDGLYRVAGVEGGEVVGAPPATPDTDNAPSFTT